MYNNWYTHYSRKSVFVQKKNYQRSHNVCFQNRQGAFHWTSLYPGQLPRIPVRISTQRKIWREKKKRDIYTHSRENNIFSKVTLWSNKILTEIFSYRCLFCEQQGQWGSLCGGRRGGTRWYVTEENTSVLAPMSSSTCAKALLTGTKVSKSRQSLANNGDG